jgi:beta-1,4-N-acetylglucosaminyltransferase
MTVNINVFVTVGTTEFAGLINVVFFSERFVAALRAQGCKSITVQIGRGEIEPEDKVARLYESYGIKFDWYRFKPTLIDDFKSANLIISHAGAGTVLEVLRLQNKKLIICVNNSLQENHQCELADALSEAQYCVSTDPDSLCETLEGSPVALSGPLPFPQADPDLFSRYLDEVL